MATWSHGETKHSHLGGSHENPCWYCAGVSCLKCDCCWTFYLKFQKQLFKGILTCSVLQFYRLAYLHEAIEPKVVHRDIKASNILIDDDFNAKLSDFGLAKLLDSGESHITTRVMGTFG